MSQNPEVNFIFFCQNMSSEDLADIKEKFAGTWKVDRNEHFEDFLAGVGVNFFIRKMAGLARPTSDIVVDLDDETITITLNSKFMKKCSSFKLDTEFEDEFQGQKTKTMCVDDVVCKRYWTKVT
ncbi:FABP9-like protein [Mya arenaria]|uniref:FABP9-like protein n=1 Tax=Mya arenaria TaxID=6604 RepID=A0ABY7DX70_MYAAR|nr:FABP9-like protein [Mya arenaria]